MSTPTPTTTNPEVNEDPSKWNYELKKIGFFGRTVPIILQNQNGPCPLIAIANILLLRGKIEIDLDYSHISNYNLISLVADCIIESNPSLRNSETLRADYERNVQDAIAALPKLQYGLDVNIKFTHCKEFEYTPETIIFDLLGIDLLHGWLVDPGDKASFEVVSSLSYNQMMEKLIAFNIVIPPASPTIEKSPKTQEGEIQTTSTTTSTTVTTPDANNVVVTDLLEFSEETSTNTTTISTTSSQNTATTTPSNNLSPQEDGFEPPSSPSALKGRVASTMSSPTTTPTSVRANIKREDIKKEDEDKIIQEGTIIRNFLESSASQLTYRGLYELHQHVKEKTLAVFFRNNHFATLFKFKEELFVLITDAGFKNEPIVWEKLDDVDNNTVFYKSDFTEYEESSLPPMLASAVSSVSSTLSALMPGMNNQGAALNVDLQKEPVIENLDEGYIPSETEVQQQLMIEQRILEQKQREKEETDRDLAVKLHKEELKNSQNAEVQEQLKEFERYEKLKEKQQKKTEKAAPKKKERDCLIQ